MAESTSPEGAAGATPPEIDLPAEVLAGLPDGYKAKFTGADGRFDVAKATRSHIEAEAALTKAQQAAAVGKAAGKAADPADQLSIAGAAASPINQTVEMTLAAAGLTPQDVMTEFRENDGKLADETYAKLPYHKATVDEYLKLADLQNATQVNAAIAATKMAQDEAGGEAQLQSLLAWAGTSQMFSSDQIDKLEERLHQPSETVGVVMELKGFHDKALRSGKATALIAGDTAVGVGAGGVTRVTKANARQLMRQAAAGDKNAQAAVHQARLSGDLMNALT
jgi:hypothetical protein